MLQFEKIMAGVVKVMKVAVIGGGSVGLLISSYLYKAGFNVTVYTRRSEQMNEIKKRGLLFISSTEKEECFPIQVKQFNKDIHLMEDIIICSVKSFEVNGVVDMLKIIQCDATSILFVQNGMGHLESVRNVQMSEVGVAVVEHGTMRQDERSVRHTGVGRIRWAFVKKSNGVLSQLMGQLSSTSFVIESQKDWKAMLEDKLIVNACINPLTALLNVENGELIENQDHRQLLRQVFNEIVRILERQDEESLWVYVCEICERTAKNRSSMLKDLDNRRRTEINSIVGYLLEQASLRSVDAPLLFFLFLSIKGLEK
ncbi:2-dehydropantoate 2-reductase [Bacillus solitudinis]|uniref:2-dehydropantoate 2-reductase n=1 Tax=Bacillus solitudinis TaxID=2014074 RepID=UPI000C235CB1|nr:2-dehydropantoate 2-reductase [Bacillus solitudinis]